MTTLTSDTWTDLGDGFEARLATWDEGSQIDFRKGDMQARVQVKGEELAGLSSEEFQELLDQRLEDWKGSIRFRRYLGELDDFDENGYLIS